MEEEYNALLANRTWELTPCPPGTNVVTGKWIFRHKIQVDGSLDRCKARCILCSLTKCPNIDIDETISPVVKPATVRTVLSLAVSRDWPIHQLDVKNAFLHGTLQETVFCSQLAGFVDAFKPDLVYHLNKSLYGLKQAPHAWYNRFANFLLSFDGTVSSPTSSNPLDSKRLSPTPRCSSIVTGPLWFIFFYMLMILFSLLPLAISSASWNPAPLSWSSCQPHSVWTRSQSASV